MIDWLRKWNHHDQEEKSLLREDQANLTGDVLKLQAKIGRGERYEEIEDQVGTIWEGIIMEKHIYIQGTSLDIHAKELIGRIKSGSILETSIIKVDLQTTIAMVKKIYKD